MKKKITLLFVSLTFVLSAFAGSFKAKDAIDQKKFDKLISKYNLSIVCDEVLHTIYKNEETSDWIYIYRQGNEKNNDKYVYEMTFMYLDGEFDSCLKYGSFTSYSESKKYLYAIITESSVAVPKEDYYSNGWHWNDPQQVFYHMLFKRNQFYSYLNLLTDTYSLEIPEDVCDKYNFLSDWFNNNSSKDAKIKIAKDYKEYLKNHKTK